MTRLTLTLVALLTVVGIAAEHAQLWINHDEQQSDAQKKLPAYYE